MYRVNQFVLVMTILMALTVGCSSNPSVRAGAWHGSTQYGDFTIHITDEGMAIKDISFSRLQCGVNWIHDRNFNIFSPHPLDGRNLEISFSIAGQLPVAEWKGRFNASGDTLRGELNLFGGLCKTDFIITR